MIEREARALLAIAAGKLEILATEIAQRFDAPAAGWRMLFSAKKTIARAAAGEIGGITLDSELQARVIGEQSPSWRSAVLRRGVRRGGGAATSRCEDHEREPHVAARYQPTQETFCLAFTNDSEAALECGQGSADVLFIETFRRGLQIAYAAPMLGRLVFGGYEPESAFKRHFAETPGAYRRARRPAT